jgi:hypothetical protein
VEAGILVITGEPVEQHSERAQRKESINGSEQGVRFPELLFVAELYSFKFSLNIETDFDPSRPFGILVLEQEEQVRLLGCFEECELRFSPL